MHLCHSRSFKVEVSTNRKPVCDFLLVINSNWQTYLVPLRSYRSLLFKFWTLHFWATLWGGGLRNNVRCSSLAHWKEHSGLSISDNWTFFPRCYGWGATGENRSKIGDFALMQSVQPKISCRGRPPPIIFAWIVRPMNALQLCCWQFSHK